MSCCISVWDCSRQLLACFSSENTGRVPSLPAGDEGLEIRLSRVSNQFSQGKLFVKTSDWWQYTPFSQLADVM